MTVLVYANEMSVEQFAKSFAPDVVVLAPKGLAERVKEVLQAALSFYEKERLIFL